MLYLQSLAGVVSRPASIREGRGKSAGLQADEEKPGFAKSASVRASIASSSSAVR